MNPRSEPLLWLQLMAIAAIPLELLALLLVLAGADPGPAPALERLLAWGLGALGPAVLLLRRPADIGSLLLVQVPAAGRSPLQRRLAALQTSPLLAVLLLGVAGLLPLLWRLDAIAALATPFSPVTEANRLVTLLLAMPLLALLVWQWQQLLQALWLLSRSATQVEAAKPLSAEELELSRLSLGLPLLLLAPLQTHAAEAPQKPAGAAAAASSAAASSSAIASSSGEPISATGAVAIEPEQQPEDQQGSDLDQQIL